MAEEYRYFQCQIESNKITLSINNPPLNILTKPLMEELDDILDDIAKDPDIKEVVITGAGRHFSAGADISEFKTIVNSPNPFMPGYLVSRRGQEVLLKIHRFPKPITAYVNGTCLGGGAELALACGKIIIESDAIFGPPETNLGIFPAWGGTQWIHAKRKLSEKVSGVIQKGLYLTAKEALDLGLVDEVIKTGREPQKPAPRPYSPGAARFAEFIIKTALEAKDKDTLEERLQIEAFMFGRALCLPDAREGVNAFFEKRQPRFMESTGYDKEIEKYQNERRRTISLCS